MVEPLSSSGRLSYPTDAIGSSVAASSECNSFLVQEGSLDRILLLLIEGG